MAMKRSFFPLAASGALVALLFLGVVSRLGRPAGRSPPPEPAQRVAGHGETVPLPLGLDRPEGVTSVDPAGWVVRPVADHEAARPDNRGASFVAFQPGRQFQAHFLDHGVRFSPVWGAGWSATLRFQGGSADSPGPVATGNRVEYEHPGGITEWYVNKPGGLEHGLTIRQRPLGAGEGDLRLEFAVEGLQPRPADRARLGAIELARPEDDRAVLLYDRLAVWDAQGRPLAAGLEADGQMIVMSIDDRDAEYPLSVDPWVTSLEATWGPREGWFGRSVALSADTALVGALDSVFVFVRSGEGWTEQARLEPEAGGGETTAFGQSVALSADTALVGADGSAFVFVRNGTSWMQQAQLLPADGSDPNVRPSFGFCVALSGDTALVGNPTASIGSKEWAGSAYVFVRSGGTWTQQAQLMAGDQVAYHFFGFSATLSGDRALVGANWGSDETGGPRRGAYVFQRFGGQRWYQEAKLTPTGGSPDDGFGSELALSGDTALVSAPNEGGDVGSVYVFQRDWTGWTQQARLASSNPGTSRYFGRPLALSGDLAMVGELYPRDVMRTGRLELFVRSDGGWPQSGQWTAEDFGGHGYFGVSLAMSGNTVLAATPVISHDEVPWVGVAYLFQVAKAVPNIIVPPSATPITYGQTLLESVLTGGVAEVPGTFAFTEPTLAPDAGVGSFEVTFTPADTAGYSPAMVMVPVSVNRAPLVIRADDQEKVVGSENPPLTASYLGFVNGDSPEDLDVPVTLSTTAVRNSPVGPYPIIARGAADANYDIALEDGVLSVVEPDIFVATEVARGELQVLDVDPGRPGCQYWLVFNRDPQHPGTCRFPSSAPGVFSGVVRHFGPPGAGVTSRFSVPLPLRLAGPRMVRVHADLQTIGAGGWVDSIRLGREITGAFSISLVPTDTGMTVAVAGMVPASGVLGIVLQLEHAWKKTSGWAFDSGLNARGTDGTSSAGLFLPQYHASTLSVMWGSQTQPANRCRLVIESKNRVNR